eukprot:210843-Prymnesium_polylepis.2
MVAGVALRSASPAGPGGSLAPGVRTSTILAAPSATSSSRRAATRTTTKHTSTRKIEHSRQQSNLSCCTILTCSRRLWWSTRSSCSSSTLSPEWSVAPQWRRIGVIRCPRDADSTQYASTVTDTAGAPAAAGVSICSGVGSPSRRTPWTCVGMA